MSIIQNVLFGKSLGLPPIILPVANFSASATSITQSNTVNFTDTSTVAPGGQAITSWTWSFEGGTPTSSNTQNPSVTYNQTGSFDVSLTAANPSGSNTKTETDYIFVTSSSVPAFSATGGTQTTVGDYTVHTFTTSGQFIVTGSRELEIFLLGRGGNGGNGTGGGGVSGTGGNGGSALTTSSLFTTNDYGIRVGGGGSLYGTTETFSALQLSSASILLQANGGNNGGPGVTTGVSAGGNGAGGSAVGSNGGAGVSNTFGGPFNTYGGGGGGGGTSAGGAGSGTDGGGNGGFNIFPTNYAATSGTANRGGGGGGGYKFTPTGGGAGGSGIVIIRYLTNP